jgi:2-haloacid dehalogenase
MAQVRSGRIPFCKLDVLHRHNLDVVLQQRGWGEDRVPDAVRADLVKAWHRLDAWPDVAPGLARLRSRFLLAPCSNGHFALMVALARRNGLVWDAITGAELARDYKPAPAVYQAAAAAFDLEPQQVLMVAAHSDDLAAAARAGLRTAFIARPDEHGAGRGEVQAACPVDLSASGLLDLAGQLGC